ncbi:PBSX family phage terminase large subunit [Pseudoleptotrichia goodfellowii]|uniref:Phage terminase, large subunit, PBSX family n=1 Tax=Pseudoleptotrichia goodfellowii F0264 TaxID=596323 RepID=D0GNY2_9FUSO|nr:PBSX family phage terminase large subunit [Pseudoleptotrichia goodfellowii]EEY34196.1 phage terminase, large subunit, PBSX family [Pseudoleptotrichia goodfellowii F0264]
MKVELDISEHFQKFIDEETSDIYFLIGSYGSGKSYNIATKLIVNSFREKRKVLGIRKVYRDVRDSVFTDLVDVISELELEGYFKIITGRLEIVNKITGSKFIFRGLDEVGRLKSIKGITDIWIEEANQCDRNDFKQLRYRLRTPNIKMHMYISTNPAEPDSASNWTYWFLTDYMNVTEETLYDVKEFIKSIEDKETGYIQRIYVNHSTYKENKFLPESAVAELNMETDPYLISIAKEGKFGYHGEFVYYNIESENNQYVDEQIKRIGIEWHIAGMDFGFSISYTAVVRAAIDYENNILYVYDEFYNKGLTNAQILQEDFLYDVAEEGIVIYADYAEPKTIQEFKANGVLMAKADKMTGNTLGRIGKIQSFNKVIIAKRCENTYRELKNLKYKKDENGVVVVGDKKKMFNFDPHTKDALDYALSRYRQRDLKNRYKEKI